MNKKERILQMILHGNDSESCMELKTESEIVENIQENVGIISNKLDEKWGVLELRNR